MLKVFLGIIMLLKKYYFLDNLKNECTDQVLTIYEQNETYMLQYMREHELGYVQPGSDNGEKSMLEDAVKFVLSILWFYQKHVHTLHIFCKKSYNNPLVDLIKVFITTYKKHKHIWSSGGANNDRQVSCSVELLQPIFLDFSKLLHHWSMAWSSEGKNHSSPLW